MAWSLVTTLGSAGLLLPILLMLFLAIWLSGQARSMRAWFAAVCLTVVMVLGSKIAFMGWGLGVAKIDFTGVSGHATLAAMVLPVWLGWLFAPRGDRLSRAGVVLGLAVAALVSWSRVELHAHSISEVIAGWLLGALATLLAYRSKRRLLAVSWPIYLAGLVFLLLLREGYATYLPTHQWEVKLALALSGRDKPFTRWHLHHPSGHAVVPMRM
jgi:membrane-associated phospholipid phosphatase